MLRCFGAETVSLRYLASRSMLHYFLSGDDKDWTSGELWKKRVAIDADPQPWLLRVDVPQRSMLRCFGAETPSSPVTPSLTAKWITIRMLLYFWAETTDGPSLSMLRYFWTETYTPPRL